MLTPLPIADRASLALTGLLTMVACSATALPIYAMARSRVGPAGSWASAVLWPLIPSAILFQPTADTAFPLLAALALAFAVWTPKGRWMAVGVGVTLGVGTQFTLAFFPVGLMVAILYISDKGETWRGRLMAIGLTGVGFVGVTLAVGLWWRANLLDVWRINAANHARFYEVYHRTYWAWVLENPVELAIAIGLPTVVLIGCGARSIPRISWATLAVLVGLTISGKNLSEVARLWLPMMPALVVAAGAGVERLGARPAGIAGTVGLLGIQTIVLEAAIQVVYPI